MWSFWLLFPSIRDIAILWCIRKLVSKGLTLFTLPFFMISRQQHVYFTSSSETHDITHWGVHRVLLNNFQLWEHWPCEPIRVQNSKILHSDWMAPFSLLHRNATRTLQSARKLWFLVPAAGWVFLPTDLACPFLTGCCFQSPSVVVLITGLPDNLRWVPPPLHTQPQLSGNPNWGNNRYRLLSAVSDLVLPWHKVQRVLAKQALL